MEILSLLLSDRAHLDDKTKKLTIEGIFNTIYASGFPAKHGEFTVIVVTEQEPEKKHHYKIQIKKDGKEIARVEDAVLTGERHYFMSRFSGTIFPEQGEYTVEVNVDDKKLISNLHLKLHK